MIYYYNSIYIDHIIYSIDMVRLSLDFSSLDRITRFGDYLLEINNNLYVEQYSPSFKAYAYRNLFKVVCRNNQTFVIGLGFNGDDRESAFQGFMEFNPNKVCDQREFREVFAHLCIHCFCADIKRWDLAVDVPLSRDLCILTKDKRKYTLVQNSELDKSEYLGTRNKSGFVKLYNKTKESDLDYDLTRLEITVGGDLTYSDFLKICPMIDVKGDQQSVNPYLDLSGTDLVLYELLMKCDIAERRIYFKKLGRYKGERLKPYVFSNTYDSDKFVVSRSVFAQLKRQLREWTIGIDYTIRDNIDG